MIWIVFFKIDLSWEIKNTKWIKLQIMIKIYSIKSNVGIDLSAADESIYWMPYSSYLSIRY